MGSVEVMWMINNTDVTQQSVRAAGHEFVSAAGSFNFFDSQRSANLTISFINDLTPSLDTRYRLTITNVSQVTWMLIVNTGNKVKVKG